MSRRERRWRVRVRSVQVLVAVGFLVLPLAAVAGWHAVGGTLAALKLGPVDLVEPAAALAAVLAGTHLTWATVLGILPAVVVALVFGPVFCSWICPWGLISELLDRLRFRGRKRGWPVAGRQRLRRGRAVVFGGLMALSLILAVPVAALISAPRLITSLPLELIFLGVVPRVTGGLLAALLVLELVGPRRLWCRALCPVGTMAKYLRTPWTLTVRWREEDCSCPRVPLCQSSCAWGIDPRRMGPFDGCTNCCACLDHCPGGLLNFGFGRQRSGAKLHSIPNAQ
ncbi:MAG: 4Fe-4S binding protein [bacterium]|nr:4Fe-4S binding protein [bacterium]